MCRTSSIAQFMYVAYVAADSSMVPAALLACLNFLFYMHLCHACTECNNYDNQRPQHAVICTHGGCMGMLEAAAVSFRLAAADNISSGGGAFEFLVLHQQTSIYLLLAVAVSNHH